jgi:dihydroxy-acid dehydratase
VQEDLHSVGGTPAVMKYLLEEGLIDGRLHDRDRQNAGGKRRRSARLERRPKDRSARSKPIKSSGHIRILRGSLAPEGAVAKITGKEGLHFSGPAKSSTAKKRCCKALEARRSPRATS